MSITPDIRASDSERELIVQRLSENAAAGRLTLAELEERVRLAYAATTRAELTPLIADLPAGQPRATRGRLKPTKWVLSVMGGAEKTGRWRVGERLTTITVMGGNDIDLRHAEIDADDVTIVAVAVMGGMDIYLPDTVDVQIGGFVHGGQWRTGKHPAPPPWGAADPHPGVLPDGRHRRVATSRGGEGRVAQAGPEAREEGRLTRRTSSSDFR